MGSTAFAATHQGEVQILGKIGVKPDAEPTFWRGVDVSGAERQVPRRLRESGGCGAPSQQVLQWLGVQRAAPLDGIKRGRNIRGQREREGVATAADAGMFEVVAIVVGEHLSEQPAIGKDVETDRRFGMIRILRPAGHASRVDDIDRAAELAEARRLA